MISHQLRAWLTLAWLDIRGRYRRTMFGPWWIVLTSGLMIGALAFVYSEIFKIPLREFLPFVALGIVIWNLISAVLVESTGVFTTNKYLFQNMQIKPEWVLARMLARNGIIFLHNAIVVVVLFAVLGHAPSWTEVALGFTGLMVLCGFITGVATIMAFLGARYRDLSQLVNAILPGAFLVTPVLWSESVLGNRRFIAEVNPLTHFVALVREPFLGHAASTLNWVVSLGLTVIALGVAARVATSYRRRLIFWL